MQNRFTRGLAGPELAAVEALFAPAVFAPGERLLREDAPNDKLILIDAGLVRLYRGRGEAAHRHPVYQVEAGAFVGEMSVLDGRPSPFGAEAAGRVEARLLQQTDLLRLLAADDALAARLLRNLIGVIVDRARESDERLGLYAGSAAMLRRYNN